MKTTNQGKSLARADSPVNGTEAHPPTDWNSVNWTDAAEGVRRLRQRIFRASQEGDLKKVRSLQKLMLRSYSNRLVSVRRVAQENKGKQTPGVDKLIAKTPQSRGMLADEIADYTLWKARPARRVYIPKSDGKRRPLGIPVIRDRALQAMVKNALEPFWEARFEATSYGFRPGRSPQDAIGLVFNQTKGMGSRRWILDADIKGAFDNISHEHLLNTIGGFPAKGLIRQWLKAGYVEMGTYHDTEAGTPQGGVVSPLLANIALHGMEYAVGVKRRHWTSKKDGHVEYTTNRSERVVVRYADDFVVFCTTKEQAEAAKDALSVWLAERGLSFSEEKTRIVHLTEGFDFLSFNIRQYKDSSRKAGFVTLIKPSKKAVQRRRDELRKEWLSLRGHPVAAVCKKLNPIIRGWANYHRHVVSSQIFHSLDNWMWIRAFRHVRFLHPHKSWGWRRIRYWGKLHPKRNDRWVFGNVRKHVYLHKFGWTPIVRHVMVKDTSSPDDPALRAYWSKRRNDKMKLTLKGEKRLLALRQNGICPICKEPIVTEGTDTGIFLDEEIHTHHVTPRKQGGSDELSNKRLLHLFCHQQVHANLSKDQTTDL